MTFPVIGDETKLSLSSSEQLSRKLSLAKIRSTTQDFDDGVVIGLGGFGKVYKGYIDHGASSIPVAIKRLDTTSNQGAPEFLAEVNMLSKLRHRNLVSLIGYCNDSEEMILVYEYLSRGTLDFHLHKADIPLTWMQRLKISIGAAHGLEYLHTGLGTQHGVIHRDVKSSNILLDENWEAKISDFGLSKIGPINQPASYVNTNVRGTFGYIDPDYFLTGRLTRKSDVFAFGVVLFELLSGRCAVDMDLDEEQCSLSRWAQLCVKERKLDQIVASNIKGQISSKCLKEFVQIAYRCLHSRAKERPTMAEVVVSLQISHALQEKFDNCAQPAGIMGLTWKMQKYFISQNKENSGIFLSFLHWLLVLYKIYMTPFYHDILQFFLFCFFLFEGHVRGPVSVDDGSDHTMSQGLKVFSYDELKSATNNFHGQMRRGCPATSAWVFKGWVDKKTYSPSIPGVGLAIAVKIVHHCYCGSLEKAKVINIIVRSCHMYIVLLNVVLLSYV